MTLRIDSTLTHNYFILLQNLGNPQSAKYDVKRRVGGQTGFFAYNTLCMSIGYTIVNKLRPLQIN